ncbi:MAG: hypothetical protein CMJ48_00880 [Planctomycetaceae bacterium]|nr:hypothetical protein [Planctomycetaceae bacterium]
MYRTIRRTFFRNRWLTSACIVLIAANVASAAEIADLLSTLKAVGPDGQGAVAAAKAVEELGAEGVPAVLPTLAAFDGAGPLAENWLRAALETIADRARRDGTALPNAELEAFVLKTASDPRARRFAYELLLAGDASARERLLPGMLDDPSPELRRDAVALTSGRGEQLIKDGKQTEAVAELRKALSGATDQDQVSAIAKSLETLKVEIDIPQHFGFLTNWKIVGPFNNRDKVGFATVYPPEKKIDLAATHEGQLGEVKWSRYSTDDDFGILDVAKQIKNYKGSVMYATTEFESAAAQDVDIRLGTPNSWKLWLNGKLLFDREEYHRGMEVDQYQVKAHLKAGRNVLLLKVCQNEQTDKWAQRYQFQLRVCDASGRAILSSKAGNDAAKDGAQ